MRMSSSPSEGIDDGEDIKKTTSLIEFVFICIAIVFAILAVTFTVVVRMRNRSFQSRFRNVTKFFSNLMKRGRTTGRGTASASLNPQEPSSNADPEGEHSRESA